MDAKERIGRPKKWSKFMAAGDDEEGIGRPLQSLVTGTVGAYDHRGWTLFERTGTSDPRLSQYGSIHESLHDCLSSSTGYGLILNVYAHLAFNDRERYGRVFDQGQRALWAR